MTLNDAKRSLITAGRKIILIVPDGMKFAVRITSPKNGSPGLPGLLDTHLLRAQLTKVTKIYRPQFSDLPGNNLKISVIIKRSYA